MAKILTSSHGAFSDPTSVGHCACEQTHSSTKKKLFLSLGTSKQREREEEKEKPIKYNGHNKIQFTDLTIYIYIPFHVNCHV